MGVKANFYHPLAEKLVNADLLAASVDLRGLGTSSVRPSSKVDFGYLDMIEDFKKTIDQLKNRYPNQKIYCLGHSLGGQIACLTLAKYPDLAEGIILTAANDVYYKGWTGKQRYANLMAYNVFPLLSRIVGYFPGHKVGFGGKAAKTQLIDWGYVGRNGIFKITGDSLNYETALKQLIKPILAIDVEGDWLAPKASMEHLYHKFNKSAPLTTFTLTQAATGKKLNHFNWVKKSDLIVAELLKWLEKI